MLSAKTKNYLHLHFLVFIAGFTAILGDLINKSATDIVWCRMSIGAVIIFGYVLVRKISFKITLKALIKFLSAGVLIALHWITFFESIKVSNISIALAMFSTGAFFASFIEPLIYKRRLIWHEIAFGVLVIIGVIIITQSEIEHLKGIVLGITSALFSTLFAVLNGKFLETHSATIISLYEFLGGVAAISIYILIAKDGFSANYFKMSMHDFWFLLILGVACTAYAFIGAVQVMKYISPYTVVLTYNLEPIYGILLAVWLFPEKEIMSINFYIGAVLIIITVLLNTYLKRKN